MKIAPLATSPANPSSGAPSVNSKSIYQPAYTDQSISMKSDTVKLSMAARVKMMHLQGMSPSAIARQVGIAVKDLGTYLPSLAQPTVTSAPAEPAGTAKAALGSATTSLE